MILFINVFLSNKTQGLRYGRGLLGSAPDRVDVFKYSLASLAPLTWSHVAIHYELGADCAHRQHEVDVYIASLFTRPVVHHYQNQYQGQWQTTVRALEALGDPLVWFCCNDDHVFVDSNSRLIERMEAVCLELLSENQFLSFVPTHWPEYVSASLNASAETPSYFVFPGQITNSMQVVPLALLRYWWFEHDYGDAWMPRTDTGTLVDRTGVTVRRSVVPPPPYPVLVPYKELVRHFDGYSHVGVDINACPPLFIPDGFFSSAIHIQYGGDRRQPGTILVDPCATNYSTIDAAGADLKITLDDLPLFWQSRVASVDMERAPEPREALHARNEAVVIMATECRPVPAWKLRVALRFRDDDDIDAQAAALDTSAAHWRLTRYYDSMNRLRTAAGVERLQTVWRALAAEAPDVTEAALADAVRLAAAQGMDH